jgi:hypothetical protein
MLTTSRGFWVYLGLSIITLGIYPLYLIHAFAKETNLVCKADGKHTSGLLVYFLLSLITCGIYAIVWNILLVDRRGRFLELHRQENPLSVGFYVIGIFFGAFTLGILTIIAHCRYLYQQNSINSFYNKFIYNSNNQ